MADAPVPDATRKQFHDVLQGHLSGIAKRYAYAAAKNPSPVLRGQARLMGSYIGTVAGKAKAAYRAGGAPSVDSHLPIIASMEAHLQKMHVPPLDELDEVTGTPTDPGDTLSTAQVSDASAAGSGLGWNG